MRRTTLALITCFAALAGCSDRSDSEVGSAVTLGPVDGHELPGTDLERIQVGDVAPDFSLQSLSGDVVTLSDFRGEKNVVLVFYRGYWCPWCVGQLSELRTLLTDETNATTAIVALTAETLDQLQLMAEAVAENTGGSLPEYTLLSDEGAAVINRYGLFNQDDARGRALPHPTTYVIDTEGVVRWKMTEVNYRIRPENEDVAAALAELE